MVEARGIEPLLSECKTDVLPLSLNPQLSGVVAFTFATYIPIFDFLLVTISKTFAVAPAAEINRQFNQPSLARSPNTVILRPRRMMSYA